MSTNTKNKIKEQLVVPGKKERVLKESTSSSSSSVITEEVIKEIIAKVRGELKDEIREELRNELVSKEELTSMLNKSETFIDKKIQTQIIHMFIYAKLV